MGVTELFNYMDKVRRQLLSFDSKDVIIIYHDDADGLSAGAIAYQMLNQLGYNIKLICIEKLLEDIIKFIHSSYNKVIFYVDIGSPHADKISRYNNSRNLTVILDHHDPTRGDDPLVYNINPEFFGLEGEKDCSGSVITYFFAKTLDKENIKLSYIALIGAQEIPGEYTGLNLLAKKDYEALGISYDFKKMFSLLQVLGPVGYYVGGPIKGIKACLEGISSEIENLVNKLEERRKTANRRMLSILYRGGLNKKRYIQWFYDNGVYRGMGTKVIGTFCSYLSYQRRLIDPHKYIVGYMDMPNEIPGLMKMSGEWIKVSSRAPRELRMRIEEGKYPGVNDFLIEAANKVGGVADGHKFAASAVLPKSKFDDFLDEAENYIDACVK